MEGRAAPSPSDIGLPQLADVGRLVREYHDAVQSFAPPEGAVWNVAIKPDREELVCHNDLAPWNLVRGAGRPVFVDWDGGEVEGWEPTPSGYTLSVSDPELAAPALARALVGADADVLSLAESHHSLEDVYLELIDEDEEAKAR